MNNVHFDDSNISSLDKIIKFWISVNDKDELFQQILSPSNLVSQNNEIIKEINNQKVSSVENIKFQSINNDPINNTIETKTMKKFSSIPSKNSPKLSSETWSCQICTYVNISGRWKCEICQSDRIQFPLKNNKTNDFDDLEIISDSLTVKSSSLTTSKTTTTTSITTISVNENNHITPIKRSSSTPIEATKSKSIKRTKRNTTVATTIPISDKHNSININDQLNNIINTDKCNDLILSQCLEDVLPENHFEDIIDQTFFNLKEPSHLYHPPIVVVIGRRVGDMKMGKNLLIGILHLFNFVLINIS